MSLELAKSLVEIEAIRFNFDKNFTYASGKKGPIYCDTRKVVGHPLVRSNFVLHLSSLLEGEKNIDAIGAMATGAISLGSLLADRLNLPFFYVRSSAKKYGAANQVEGVSREWAKDKKCILFEDLINSGGSVSKGALAVKEVGFDLHQIISLVDYDFEVSKKLLAGLGRKNPNSLIRFDDIIKTIPESNEELRSRLKNWHEHFYV